MAAVSNIVTENFKSRYLKLINLVFLIWGFGLDCCTDVLSIGQWYSTAMEDGGAIVGIGGGGQGGSIDSVQGGEEGKYCIL